jgi:hypothetical protein
MFLVEDENEDKAWNSRLPTLGPNRFHQSGLQ